MVYEVSPRIIADDKIDDNSNLTRVQVLETILADQTCPADKHHFRVSVLCGVCDENFLARMGTSVAGDSQREKVLLS